MLIQDETNPNMGLAAMAVDVKMVEDLMTETFKNYDISAFMEQFRHVVTYVQAANGAPVSAIATKTAQDYLSTADMNIVCTAIATSTLGRTMKDAVDQVVARAATDYIADQKVKRAVSYADDKRLLNISTTADPARVRVLNLETCPGLTTSQLQESLGEVMEAMVASSKMFIEEMKPALHQWLEAVLRRLCMLDLAFSAYMYNKGSDAAAFASSSHEAGSSSPDAQSIVVYDPVLRNMRTDAMDEHIYCKLLESIVAALRPYECFAPELERVQRSVDVLLANSKSRRSVNTSVDLILEVMGMHIPGSAEDAVANFIEHASKGTEDGSFICMVQKLKSEFGSLVPLSRVLFEEAAEIVISCGKELTDEQHPMRMGDVHNFPVAFPTYLPAIAPMLDILESCADHVFNEVKMSAALRGQFNTCTVQDIEQHEGGVDQQLDLLVSSEIHRRAASQVIRAGTTADGLLRLPAAANVKLLSTLITGAGSDAWVFDPDGLVQSSSPEVAWDGAPFVDMLEVYSMVHDVAVMLSVFRLYFVPVGKTFEAVKNGSIKPDIKAALLHLSTINVALLARLEVSVASESAKAWLFTPAILLPWTKAVAEVVDNMKVCGLQQLAEVSESLASRVDGFNLEYDHFASDDIFVTARAKKALSEWKHQAEHAQATLELFRAGNTLKETHAVLDCKGVFEVLMATTNKRCGKAFAKAKVLMKVVACINTVVNLKGQEQLRNATSLQQKGLSDIPVALEKQVSALAAKFVEPAAKKRKT